MDRTKENGPFICAQMPDAATIIASDRFMPKLSAEMREKVRDIIIKTEGSPKDGGMTCIAVKDFPVLAEKINEGIEDKELTDQWNLGYRTRLRGFIRNMNRHCDECSTVCGDWVQLTREQLRVISREQGYTNSRRAKVLPPAYEEFKENVA